MKIQSILLLLLIMGFTGAFTPNVQLVANISLVQINQLPPVMVHLYEQLHPNYVNLHWDTIPETNASILVFTNNVGIEPGNPGQVQQIPVLFNENATFAINHSIRVPNLIPSTVYWYSIRYCNSDNWCNATLRNFRTPAQEFNAMNVVQINQSVIRINGSNFSVMDVQDVLANRYINTCTVRVNATDCKYGYLVKVTGANLTNEYKMKLFSHLNYTWQREVYYGMGFGYPLQIACRDIMRGLVSRGSLERRFTPLLDLCQVEVDAPNAQGDYCAYAIANTSECPELQLQNRPQGQVAIDDVNDQNANPDVNVNNQGANGAGGNAGGSSGGSNGAVAPNAANGGQNGAVVDVNGNAQPNLVNASQGNAAANNQVQNNSGQAQNNASSLGLNQIIPGVDDMVTYIGLGAIVLILLGAGYFATKKKKK